MRHNKTGKLNLWTIARLSVLALCFVVAFAFALTSDVFDGNDANAKVASAELKSATAGGAGSFAPSKIVEGASVLETVTADTLGYPGISAGVRNWSQTLQTTGTTYSDVAVLAFSTNGSIFAPGNPSATLNSDTIGEFVAGFSADASRTGLVAYMNCSYPGMVADFVSKHDAVTVTATVSCTVSGTWVENHDDKWIKANTRATTGAAGIADIITLGDNSVSFDGTEVYKGSNGTESSGDKTYNSGAVTLAKGTNNLSIAFELYHGGTNSRDCKGTLTVKNLIVTYTVTMPTNWTDSSSNEIWDGASPQCESFSNYDGTGGFYNPTTNNTGSGWAYYPSEDPSGVFGAAINSVKTAYNSAIDSVPGDAKGTTGNTAKLYSYVDSRSTSEGGDKVAYGQDNSDYYFKRISLSFKDYYNYAGAAEPVAGDSCDIWYASGLKSLKVGITTVDVSSGAAIGLTPFNVTTTAGEVQGGQFEVSRTNRVNLTVTIYIKINCKVDVATTDFGGATSSNRMIDVKGIDMIAPTDTPTMDTIDGTAALYTLGFSDWNSIAWTTDDTFTVAMNQNEDSAEGAAPYMWFYAVQKADTPQAAAALTPIVWNETTLRTKIPFAVKNLASFDYDFANGVASPTYNSNGTVKYGVNAQNGGENVTGPGYYLFTFFTMDMCGNAGTTSISYFVKADYLAPQNEITLVNGAKTIAENGDWASVDELKVRLNQSAVNLSGNTLTFSDYNGDPHSVAVNGTGNLADAYNIIAVDGVGIPACTSCTVLDGAYQIVINYVYTAPNGSNPASAVWEIVFGSNKHPGTDNYENLSFVSKFTLLIGTDPEPEKPVEYYDKGDPVYDTDGTTVLYYKWQYLSGKRYNDGVYIRLDRNAPETPQIYDSSIENEYFVEGAMTESEGVYTVNTYAPGELRSWLNAWTYDATVSFSENLINDFSSEIKVYVGMKNIVFFDGENNDYLTLKENVTGSSVNNFYINYLNGDHSNAADFYDFDRVSVLTGAELSSGSYTCTVNMLSALGSGLRVFYVWSVDQAGNYSELGIHYVFVDNTTYYVKSDVDRGIFDAETCSVTGGGTRVSIKRGAFYENSYTLAEGFAPYKLVSTSNGVVSELWMTEDPTSFSQSSQGKVATINGSDFSMYFDKSEDYGSMKSAAGESNDILITFQYRKVITFAITNTTVKYAGAETAVPYSVSDEASRASMQYLFKGNGTTEFNLEETVNVIPTNIGNYTLSMWMDDESYVTLQDGTNQNIAYTIAKADLVVTATSSTNQYGSVQALDYTLSGLVGGDVGIRPWNVNILVLQNASEEEIAAGYNTYPVGLYRVVLGKDSEGVEWDLNSASSLDAGSEFPISNYRVTFVGAYHNVSKQIITVYVAANQSKTFGDADGNFRFYVKKDSLPSSLHTAGMSDADLIANLVGENGVFKNAEYTDEAINLNFYMRAKNGASILRREAGEDVGNYAFTSYADNFDLDENYSVIVDVTTPVYFTITQRTVVLTPYSGQIFNYNAAGTYDISFGFANAADSVYRDYLTKGFSLASTPTGGFTQDENFIYYTYAVVTDSNDSTVENTVNILFTTSTTTATAQVKEIKNNPEKIVVTISAKAGQILVYGEDFGTNGVASKVTYNPTAYNISFSSGSMPANSTIEWTATLYKNGSTASKNTDGYFNAGEYSTQISSAQLLVNGVVSSDHLVSVESYSVSFTPAPVTVTPSATSTTKAYGQLDTVYGIGFSAAGSGVFASKNFSTLISGNFIRGIYAEDGTYVRAAERFDYASNENGEFSDGDDICHYSLGIGTAFASIDPNFYVIVDESTLDAFRMEITPTVIELNQKDFYGKNKVFDSNTQVKYATGEKESVVNLSSYLVRSTDKVYVDFDANYDTPEAGSGKIIIFNNLSLGGEHAQNYVLYFEGVPILPEDCYIVTTLPDGSPIQITLAPFTLIKSYFTFTKEYDGTTAMTKDNLSISNECRLYGTPFILEPTTINFASPSVTANYATNVTLFFEGVTGELVFDEENSESGISVEYVSSPIVGMRVTILNLSGSITKKTITMDKIEALSAVSRKYNGKTDVNIEYSFDNSVLGQGDTIDDIGLTFVANVSSANIGEYDVTFSGMTFETNSNYCVDFTVADLNAAYSGTSALKATISKAEVALNVVFNSEKQYSGSTNTTLTKNTASTPTADLAGMDVRNVKEDGTSLNKFNFVDTIDSVVWAADKAYFDYTWSNVVFDYIIDGVPNASVAFNGTEIVKHDVRVSNLTLNSVGTKAATDAVLNNYCLKAYVYDAETESYILKQIDLKVGSLGTFDLHKAATLDRKELKPNVNGVQVSDKIYDATVLAPVTLTNKVQIGVAEEDKDYVNVVFNAAFETKNVGTQKVTIRITGLEDVLDGEKVNRQLAKNYVITTVLPCFTNATIFAAPLLVTASVGSKVYDGTNSVASGNISISTTGYYPAETDVISVTARYASYNGKDVDTTSAEVGYFEILSTSNTSINYYLVYASDVDKAGKIETDQLGAITPAENTYYYPLTSRSAYVLTQVEYEQIAGTPEIIGAYKRSRVQYVIIDAAANKTAVEAALGEEKETVSITSYDQATGTILPKPISIAISKTEGSTAFSKSYDGTNVFTGVYGTDYLLGQSTGIIAADSEYVVLDSANVIASYNSASAGSTYVNFLFGAGSIAPKDGVDAEYANLYLNYACSEEPVKIVASIEKLPMKATLNSTSFNYGSKPASFANKVDYTIGTATVYTSGNSMYLKKADYQTVFSARWAQITALNETDKATALNGRIFTKDTNGVYTACAVSLLDDAEADVYFKLSGVQNIPTVIASSVTSLTKVGNYSYTLTGGTSTNYAFEFAYTQFDVNGNVVARTDGKRISDVKIEKAVLTISTSTVGQQQKYVQYYGKSTPKVELLYSGFKNSDGVSSIAVAPTVTFRLCTINEDDTVTVGETVSSASVLTSKLASNQKYLAIIDLTSAQANNYTFELGENANGSGAAYLDIVMAPLTGLVLNDIAVSYNGQDRTQLVSNSIIGKQSGDVIDIKFYDSALHTNLLSDAAKNAGVYYAVVTVSRNTVGEEGYDESCTLQARLTINKVDLSISLSPKTFNYDGSDHEFDLAEVTVNGAVESELASLKNAFVISITKDDEVLSYPIITDAGSYSVKVEFTYDYNDTSLFARNYNKANAVATYTIKPAEIIITVNADTLRQKYPTYKTDENGAFELDADGNKKEITYGITYTYKLKDTTSGLSLSKLGFKTTYYTKKGFTTRIKAAGVYHFEITYDDPNFKTVGNNTGIYYCGEETISLIEDDVTYVILTLPSGTNIASTATLERYEYYSAIMAEKTESEVAYWNAVNAYMPGIADAYHTTSLLAIAQVKLIQNGSEVSLPKDTTVNLQVRVPYNVTSLDGVEIYYVNATGGLTRVNNSSYDASTGLLSYEAPCVSSIVFVKVDEINMLLGMPYWVWGAIGGGAILAITVLTIGIVVGVKKKKKKLLLATEAAAAGDGLGGDAPKVDTALQAQPIEEEDSAMKALPYEEPAPAPIEEPKPEVKPEVKQEIKSEPEPVVTESAVETRKVEPVKTARPEKPEHVGKKKPPIVGLKLDEESSVTAAIDKDVEHKLSQPEAASKKPPVVGEKSKAASASETDSQPAAKPAVPENLGKKKPPVVGKKPTDKPGE